MHVGPAGDVDEHRAVACCDTVVALPCPAHGGGDYERIDGVHERRRQRAGRLLALAVTIRDPRLVVLHLGDDRKWLTDLISLGVLQAEYHFRAAVVGGWLKGHHEAPRKEVLPVIGVVGRVRDEDVRERRGRIGDVSPLVEQAQQVTDGLVDRSGVMLGIALPLALLRAPRVDRGVVRFIVNEQQGKAPDGSGRVAEMVQPCREVFQDPLVLLGDDEDPDVVDIDRRALELAGGEVLVPGGDGLADDVGALEAQRPDPDDH